MNWGVDFGSSDDRQSWFKGAPRPPKYHDAVHHLKNFESSMQVAVRAKNLASALIGRDPKAAALGTDILACHSSQRCGVSMCPRCLRYYRRRLLIPGVLSAIGAKPAVALSLVAPGLAVGLDDLNGFDLARSHERLQAELRAVGIHEAIAGVDFSVNEPIGGKPFWQVHYYVIALNLTARHLDRKALGDAFPAEDGVARPVHVRLVEDRFDAASYLLKPFFWRRISYLAQNGRMATTKRGLRQAQLREIAIYLSSRPPIGRLTLLGEVAMD